MRPIDKLREACPRLTKLIGNDLRNDAAFELLQFVERERQAADLAAREECEEDHEKNLDRAVEEALKGWREEIIGAIERL